MFPCAAPGMMRFAVSMVEVATSVTPVNKAELARGQLEFSSFLRVNSLDVSPAMIFTVTEVSGVVPHP